jgi:hypothetical protein
MLQMLLASENLLFSAALMLLVLIAVAEVSALLIGQSLSGTLDSLLPETEINPHTEIGAVDADTALSRLLGWLRIGQVPLLMLLVIFLLNFGVLGFLLQGLSMTLLGFYLPAIVAGFATFFLVLPCVRFWGGMMEKVMPRDETTAVSADTLIGRIGVITLGTARADTPAEAKVRDEHGFSHYLQVVPDDASEELPQGSVILVISRVSGTYKVIKNSNPWLNDQPGNIDQPNH